MIIVFWLVMVLFILVSILLPTVVLLQEAKQGGLGEGLGGGGGQDFGQFRGATGGLHRITIYLGVTWGLLALLLGVLPRA